jgi:hypothetical protein
VRSPTRGLTPDEREEFEERAAIMHYDGGLTRQGAEWQARQIVLRKRWEREDGTKYV